MINKFKYLILALTLLTGYFLNGCIDTDYIADPQLSKGKVKITSASSSVFEGDSINITAELQGMGGGNYNEMINYYSSDDQIASVNQNGTVFGSSVGQVFIYAAADGFEKDSLRITVVNDTSAVSSIVIAGSSNQMNTGDTLQLTAKAYNINGGIVGEDNFIWQSSDSSILTVDQNGLVTAVSAGSGSIIASLDNVSSQPYSISVSGQTRSGTFVKAPNQSHNVSGSAMLAVHSNGNLVLSFGDNFTSSGGPDVRVYLSNVSGVNSSSLDLGSLKSTAGMQTYDVPSGVGLNDYNWVVIHCVPFNITFGYAELK